MGVVIVGVVLVGKETFEAFDFVIFVFELLGKGGNCVGQ